MVDGAPGLSRSTPGRVLIRLSLGTSSRRGRQAPVHLDTLRGLGFCRPTFGDRPAALTQKVARSHCGDWSACVSVSCDVFSVLDTHLLLHSLAAISMYSIHCLICIPQRVASIRLPKCIDKDIYVYSPFSCPNSAPVKERISLAGWPGHRRAMYHRRDHASITTKYPLLTSPHALPPCHLSSPATSQ